MARLDRLGAPASCRHGTEGPWRTRGYLPHFDRPHVVQAITFRLADSLPTSVLQRWEPELVVLRDDVRDIERRRRIEAWLDRGVAACHLRDPRVASVIEAALLHFDGERYRLIAWCVMPNHVHAIVESVAGHAFRDIVHSWKSFTAKEANRILGRRGSLWQREYHDRFIRNHRHLELARRYVEANPVTAGLAARPDEWRWSSAWDGRANR